MLTESGQRAGFKVGRRSIIVRPQPLQPSVNQGVFEGPTRMYAVSGTPYDDLLR